MAQSERFYFWRGYYDAMEYLNDDEVGRLFRAICAYAFDGEEPDFDGERVLQVAWTMVADTARESVEMGKRASEYGKQGGRPANDKKSPPKSPPKRGAKRVPKSPPERVPESVEYGKVLSPSATEREFATLTGAPRLAPDGARAAPLAIPPNLRVPPKPGGEQ